MIKAVVLDFYGTIAEESYNLLDRVAGTFLEHGANAAREEICGLWWKGFRAACDGAHGKTFALQKELYPRVFAEMAEKTGARGLDYAELTKDVLEFAVSSPMLEDARRFFAGMPSAVLYFIEHRQCGTRKDHRAARPAALRRIYQRRRARI